MLNPDVAAADAVNQWLDRYIRSLAEQLWGPNTAWPVVGVGPRPPAAPPPGSRPSGEAKP